MVPSKENKNKSNQEGLQYLFQLFYRMKTGTKPPKNSFKEAAAKSINKLPSKMSQSTVFSILTGKRVKTEAEITEDIKTRRVRSYQKISFHIRKMDTIFKGDYQPECPQNFDLHSGFNQEPNSPTKSNKMSINKAGLLLQKTSNSREKLKMATGTNFYKQKDNSKGNIISRGDLLTDSNLRKSESPLRVRKDNRIMTQHVDTGCKMLSLENELVDRKATWMYGRDKQRNVIGALSNDKQEGVILNQESLPGISFKLQPVLKTQGNQSNFSKSGSSFFGSKSTYLHHSELMEKDSDERVTDMVQLRKSNHLIDFPKQWHLYNCLKLNQLSLYRTNLKLSCEKWTLIDYLQLKYLRGWHPKETGEFSSANRLFAARILLDLKKRNKIDFERLQVRVNNSIVRRKMDDNSAVLVDTNFTLATNTIIPFWDLFVGMLLTKKEDLTWHLIYGLCHLFKAYNMQDGAQNEDIYQNYICLSNDEAKLRQYDQIYLLKCKGIIESLQMKQTTIEFKKRRQPVVNNEKTIWGANTSNSVFKEVNQYHYLLVRSTCIDMSMILIECLSYPPFVDLMVKANPVYKSRVRAQIGFKFWQPKTHLWKNEFGMYNNSKFIVIVGRNEESQMMSILAYDYESKATIVCGDCKLNMCLRDICSIKEWMKETFKRFRPSPPKREPRSLEGARHQK